MVITPPLLEVAVRFEMTANKAFNLPLAGPVS
jgi:hypothetical protein